MRIMTDQHGVKWVCSLPKPIYVGVQMMLGRKNFPVVQLRKLGSK